MNGKRNEYQRVITILLVIERKIIFIKEIISQMS